VQLQFLRRLDHTLRDVIAAHDTFGSQI
jgi:hypothetical protein